ncbi:TPA: hypothetical protein ACJIVJ_003431 [Yersinia enterocolitica]|uniref:hypothetical protein n=1 Tax=Yersinia enterocolitica TaxID=630 RepID=UPI00313E51F8
MRLIRTTLLTLPVLLLISCSRPTPVVNIYHDVTSGDTAKVRIIGFTEDSHIWSGYDCNEPYKMPEKGYYPHVRQSYEGKPVFIDKGFTKTELPKGKYPIDMAEFYVHAGKLTTVWASYHTSDQRLCQKTITIRPEKDELYEFRNRIEGDICVFELYKVSPGQATALPLQDFQSICKKPGL